MRESSLGGGKCLLLWRFIGRRVRGSPAQHPRVGLQGPVPLKVPFRAEAWPVSAPAGGTEPLLALPRWLSHQIPAAKVWEWALTPIPLPRSPDATGLENSKHQWPAQRFGPASLACALAAACNLFLTKDTCCSSWKKDDFTFFIPPNPT